MKAFAVFFAVFSVASASKYLNSIPSCSVGSIYADGAGPVEVGGAVGEEIYGGNVFSPNGIASSRLIAPRQYRVALDNCGPKARRLPAVSATPVTTSPVVSPTVTLPYKVPRTRTVSNNCRCVKTIVKAQPVEQVITIPVIRRFVQTLSRPKVQTINYSAIPVNCPTTEDYNTYCAYA